MGRIALCRKELRTLGAGGLLLTSDNDYFYLMGYTPNQSAVIVTRDEVHVITDARFENEAKREVLWARVWMRRGVLHDEIGNVCQKLRIKKLAVQAGHFTLSDQAELRRRVKGMKLVPASPFTTAKRKVKSPSELAIIRRSIRTAEEAFLATRKTIRVGQTEREMAARLEYEMKRRGAEGVAFPTICAEGAHSALPHAVPGGRRVKKGSAVLFDWGAKVGRYCSDLTRMVFIGSIPRTFERLYPIVLDAQLAAIAEIRPGRRMCDVDAVARKAIAKSGYGKRFTHGLGHGFGLDIHEAPSLSWRSEEKLETGMVVTVEPGVYLPGFGGVRIEDDVLVTRSGCRVLTSLPKSLSSAVI
ncbi:MAG: Xaa-Pro peptidase family protein [Planctomycetota bacterium]